MLILCSHYKHCYVFHRYALRAPNDATVHTYVTTINKSLMEDKSIKESLTSRFNDVYNTLAAKMSPKIQSMTACRLVAKKLVRDSLTLRKKAVAQFLSTVRAINRQVIDINTFDNGQHTAASEPFFFDTAYKTLVALNTTVVDRKKKCVLSIKKPIVSQDETHLDVAIAVHSSGFCLLDTFTDKLFKVHLLHLFFFLW